MGVLKQKYKDEVVPALQGKFNYRNPMLIPSLKKIIIHMGVAETARDKNDLEDCIREMTALSGQKPIVVKAKRSVAGFKLREGMPVGIQVTMRGQRMLDFMERFVHIICPAVRDFRGINTKCDGRGNFTMGLDDQSVFPELDLDKVKRTQGMHITFVTSAQTDEECLELLRGMGLPFKTAA